MAFQLGGFTIYWYGILTALGFLAAFWTGSRRAPREGFSPEVVLDLAPWLIGGAIVGARTFYVATHWPEISHEREEYRKQIKDREEWARTIIQNGWPLREVRLERATLEEFFIQVTAEQVLAKGDAA